MTITRTATGRLWNDAFDTDTRANYTLIGTTGYDSVDKRLQLAQTAGTTGQAEIPPPSLSAHDMIVTGKFIFPTYTTSSTQYLIIYSRYIASPLFQITASISDGNSSPTDTITLRMYKEGVNSDLTSFPYTINRITEYRFKLSTIGAAIRFKIWPATEAEPQSWNATYDLAGDYGGSGTSRLYAYLLPTEYDDWRIYSKNAVTCSGLPAGYKFRVGGVVATEAGGMATVDCSHVTFPVSVVEVLDGSGSVVDSLTLVNDIWGGDTYNYSTPYTRVEASFPVESALMKQIGGQYTASAVASKINTTSFAADAGLILHREIGFVSEAVLKKSIPQSPFNADAALRKAEQKQITVDSSLLKTYKSPVAADAIFKKSPAKQVTANSVVRKTGISGSFMADSCLMPDQTYTLSRSSTGKLLFERFDTNTLANYTTGGTVYYNSANKNLELGADNSSSSGWLKDDSFDQNDCVFTCKLTQLGTGVYSYSLDYLFIRRIDGTSGNTDYLIEFNDSSDTIKMYREHTDGTIIEIAPAVSFSPARGTTYIAKFSATGSAIKFKLWDAGTAEPQSWMMEATDTWYTHGKWEVYSYQLKSSVDDIAIYKSHTVTCSGLADGQKFRVGGASGKVAAASGGVAAVDCSHLTFPVSLVEVLDASDNVVMSYTATDDIWGGDTFEMKFYRKFYADAALIKGGVKPVTLDAVLLRGGLGNFTSGAMMKKTVYGGTAVDAVIRKNIKTPFTVDALAWRYGGTITGLSVLKKYNVTASFTSGADLQPFVQVVTGIPADCMLFKPGFTITIPADAVFKKYLQNTVLADARLMKRTTVSFTADARMQWVRSGTIIGLSVLRKEATPSFAGSSVLCKQRVTTSIPANAVIRRQLSAAINTGAIFRKPDIATSLAAGAVIRRIIENGFTVNAGLPARFTSSISANAFVTRTHIKAFIPGAIMFKTVNRSFGADAYIWDLNRYLINPAVNIERSFQIDTAVAREFSFDLNVVRKATFDLNVGFN